MTSELCPLRVGDRRADRPKAAREHHLLEDVLAHPMARRVLGAITRLDASGTCFFERACEKYNNRGLTRKERWKWCLLTILIDFGLKCAKLDKNLMTRKLFHHQPTVRSLALVAEALPDMDWPPLKGSPPRSWSSGT